MSRKTVEDTHFELSAAMVNHRICFVPEAVLYVDQDFRAERLKVRNHVVDNAQHLKNRSGVFERILMDFPFESLGGESSWYINKSAYDLSIFFQEGPLSYAAFLLRLLIRGRFRAAMYTAFRFPAYLSRRRRQRQGKPAHATHS
jgi:hypothetical protein